MVAKFNGHVYNYNTKIRAAFYMLKGRGKMLQNWHQGAQLGSQSRTLRVAESTSPALNSLDAGEN
jgi:hypothetical protein